MVFKRCLIGLHKGVSKTPKGHLLQFNWASFRSQKSIFHFSMFDFLLQSSKKIMYYLRLNILLNNLFFITIYHYHKSMLHIILDY